MKRLLLPSLAALALATAIPASAAPPAPDLLEHAAFAQAPAPAPAPAVMPSAEDPIALAGAIIDAVKAKRWLLAVSPAIVLLVLLLRRYGAKRFPWLDTKRGGYALSLAAALGVAIWAAATTPGAIGVLQVLVAAAIIWLTNDKVYEALKGLIWPDGAAKAEIVALDAGVAGAKTAAGAAKSPEAAADALNLVAGGKG